MIYFPADEFTITGRFDRDLGADYLELMAMSAENEICLVREIIDALEATLERGADLREDRLQFNKIEDLATDAANRVQERSRILGNTYPFKLTDDGSMVCFTDTAMNHGRCAYIVSLLLSNLSPSSALMNECLIHPNDAEIRELRTYFQCFATAAMAAEICGSSWSFGFPRLDGSGFLNKLEKIWRILKDGTVYPDPSAPRLPKDDKIDVIACRVPKDGLPGSLIAVAQVSTGKNWKDKSIKSYYRDVFSCRWFQPTPVTQAITYHIIPFARPDESFRDDVLFHGNILHRTRLPLRVEEANGLSSTYCKIEAFEKLPMARMWIKQYFARIRTERRTA